MTRIRSGFRGIGLLIVGAFGFLVLLSLGGASKDSPTYTCQDLASSPPAPPGVSANGVSADWSWFPFGLRCTATSPVGTVQLDQPSWGLSILFLVVIIVVFFGCRLLWRAVSPTR